MNNVLLGKTIRAMYKLSGKTLPQLSEETGMSVDSINNLFYARIQKPGLSDLCALTKAMGFSISQLTDFVEQGGNRFADTDNITEAFTLFLANASDPNKIPVSGTVSVHDTIAEQQRYEEKLTAQFLQQIDQLKQSSEKLEQHYSLCINELRGIHAQETKRQDDIIAQDKRTIRRLRIALIGLIAVFFILSMIDVLNLNVGWLR